MRYITPLFASWFFLSGCGKSVETEVISERYIHKYDYAVSKDEFEKQGYPGQVITVLKNGVTVTATYEDGLLHGPFTRTFPDSQTVESYSFYKQGTLVKEIVYNSRGIPIKEEAQLAPHRYSCMKWYAKGSPLSSEEYLNDAIVKGEYYDLQNELESAIEGGEGIRTLRDSKGVLLAREYVEEGQVFKRELFYSNGSLESISHHVDNLLHGERIKYGEDGQPLSIEEYVKGVLHGKTTLYQNGARAVEIHYLDGLKNGLETHYLDGEIISKEILWENDKKHGPSKYYVGDSLGVEYFYDGKLVDEEEWNRKSRFDAIIGQIDTNW